MPRKGFGNDNGLWRRPEASGELVALSCDGEAIDLDRAVAERLYDMLWSVALEGKPKAIDAAMQLRRSLDLMPAASIGFTDEKAAAVRRALQELSRRS